MLCLFIYSVKNAFCELWLHPLSCLTGGLQTPEKIQTSEGSWRTGRWGIKGSRYASWIWQVKDLVCLRVLHCVHLKIDCVLFFFLLENQAFRYSPVRFQTYFTHPVPLWTLCYIYVYGQWTMLYHHWEPVFWLCPFSELCLLNVLILCFLKMAYAMMAILLNVSILKQLCTYSVGGWCSVTLPTLLSFKMQRELNVGEFLKTWSYAVIK